MTRAEYVSLVQTMLDNEDADAGKITIALNWTVNDLYTNNRLRMAEASDELYAGANDYELELPDDLDTILDEGFYSVSPQVLNMTPNFLTYERFMARFPNFKTASASNAGYWTTFGNLIRFAAPLLADHEFTIDYLRKPVDVVLDSDEVDIPDNYSELVARLTKARFYEMEDEYDNAVDERTNAEPLRINFIRKESRGQLKTGGMVIRTNWGRPTDD